MFNQLLSNLPFNPSLINQVSFYATRLKHEASIRRLGFILVTLIMIVQMFAVFAPAQPSLASSGSDLLPGGFDSKEQLEQICRGNVNNYGTILGHFGISCSNLRSANVTTIRGNDENDRYYSTARQQQGPTNVATGKATDEVRVDVSGLKEPLYARKLSSWDKKRSSSSYKALSVKDKDGGSHYLLYSCGNVVQPEKPKPSAPPPAPAPKPTPIPAPTPAPSPKPTPKPKPAKPCLAAKDHSDTASCLVLSKSAKNLTQNIASANNTMAKAGDTITYTITTKNTGSATVKDYVFQEDLSDVLEYADVVNLGGAAKSSNGILSWPASNIAAGSSTEQQITVKVKSPVPKTPSPCANSVVSPCPASNSFDLAMTNVYGASITVKVEAPVAKTIEKVTTTTLPNTGAGISLIGVFGVTALVGYFYARSRLLAQELAIVKAEYTTSGGI